MNYKIISKYIKYLDFKTNDIVVVNFSGRGDKDLDTYIEYFNL